MTKQIVAYTYNTVLLTNKKEWTNDIHNMAASQIAMLSERSQKQKSTCCMIPFNEINNSIKWNKSNI